MRSFVFLIWFFLWSQPLEAHEVRLESGIVHTGYNRFAIPNPGGTRVFFQSDSQNFYFRLQGKIQLSERASLKLLFAPLTAGYSFVPSETVAFNGTIFSPGQTALVNYKFNSYRLGYVYDFYRAETLSIGGGILAKVRDAKIQVKNSNSESTYSDVGIVPLFHLNFRWNFLGPWSLRSEVDGAAAKQGRALDGNVEMFYQLQRPGNGISAGYRILEGGADNTKVFTFTLLHYYFLAYTMVF